MSRQCLNGMQVLPPSSDEKSPNMPCSRPRHPAPSLVNPLWPLTPLSSQCRPRKEGRNQGGWGREGGRERVGEGGEKGCLWGWASHCPACLPGKRPGAELPAGQDGLSSPSRGGLRGSEPSFLAAFLSGTGCGDCTQEAAPGPVGLVGFNGLSAGLCCERSQSCSVGGWGH